MILLLHDVIGNSMTPFAANAAAIAAAKIANAFEWPRPPPKIAPYLGGSALPSNTWFLRPTRVFIQNGTSIGSAIFAQLTVSQYFTMGSHDFPCPFLLGDRVPHVTHGT